MKGYLFDLELSAKALRLNRFLHDFVYPEKRELFHDHPEEAMQSLSEIEKAMVRNLDWKGMMN